MIDSRLIGLYEVTSVGCFPGFRIIITLASLSSVGQHSSLSIVLYSCRRIFWPSRGSSWIIWAVIRSGPGAWGLGPGLGIVFRWRGLNLRLWVVELWRGICMVGEHTILHIKVRFTGWINMATDRHSDYVILVSFRAKNRRRKHLFENFFLHCLSCLAVP
jgi:hypothetical protein